MRKRIPGRRVLAGVLIAVVALGLVHVGSMVLVDRKLHYVEIALSSHRVTAALDGYTIAFLTDIHGTGQADLENIVGELDRRSVDLVLLGGDFSGQQDLGKCLEILSAIPAADGFYGVEGNHDSADRLRQSMSDHGMTLLENRGVRIRQGLYVGGVEDLWNRTPDVDLALGDAHGDDVVLLLAHNPDVSMERDCTRADLVLSGHTHGGEITFLGVYTPSMRAVSHYGQRFRSGWCRGEGEVPVYVSNGIGSHMPRVFAPRQVVVLTLKAP